MAANAASDEILPSAASGRASPATPTSNPGQVPLEQPPRPKGRHRLLQNLQRISSSPSLQRRPRSHSEGYQRDGKAALSCVSLSPAQCWADPSASSPSQIYGGLSPNSPSSTAAPSPGSARIRSIEHLRNDSPQTSVPLPADIRPASRSRLREMSTSSLELTGDITMTDAPPTHNPVKSTIDFWRDMPYEIQLSVLGYLTPKEIVRCSLVSKAWYQKCFDGQLWSRIDTAEYYNQISSDALLKLITSAGPFVKDLNLRGCVQLREKWQSDGERISDACRNVVNFSLEGCRIDKTAIHCFLLRNPRLEFINLSGLSSVTNSAMKIIAQTCTRLDTLNLSWCSKVDTRGLKPVIENCPRLRDLRAGEIAGFDSEDIMQLLFEKNSLERLVIHRTDVTDQSLKALIHGKNPEIDLLTDRPIVPPRMLKHLDLHNCANLTDDGVKSLVHNVPLLEVLQLSHCTELTDSALMDLVQTTPKLTHLELEELDKITNTLLIELAKSPCAEVLEHLSVSFCEAIGDFGMLAILKSCPRLRYVEMDNTRISDLSLIEASYRVRKRGYGTELPQVGLYIVAFDCVNVTWAGVREVLSSNAYLPRSLKSSSTVVTVRESGEETDGSTTPNSSQSPLSPVVPAMKYPKEIIQLKCFYGWQMTVDEHNKRVLRGSLTSANKLARKWADYMMAAEEAGTGGAGARRRRRRARDAERIYNFDDDDDDDLGLYVGRRRRARSGGCMVM